MSSISGKALTEGLEHLSWLRRLAEGMVQDRGLASDLALDACQAMRAKGDQPIRNPRAFLRGVLHKLVLKHRHAERTRTRHERACAEDETYPASADLAGQLEVQRLLLEQVERLQPAQREVILLRYYHQLSAAEIAERLELPAATIRKRLQRGLEELRQALDRRYPDQLAWAALLLPLSHPSPAIPQCSLPIAVGAPILMSKSVQLGLAAVVLIAVGWFVMASVDPFAPAISSEPGNAGEAVAVPTAEIEPAVDSKQASVETEKVARNRIAAPGFMHLQVLEANEQPFAEGRVFMIDAEARKAQSLATDAEGLLRLEADGRQIFLVFDRPGSFPYLHATEARAEQHLLRLPGTDLFGGRLVLNGQAPPEAITLRLDSDHAVITEPKVVKLLEENLGFTIEASLKSNQDGSFAFHGLPTDWSGTLTLGLGYRRASANYRVVGLDRMHFDAPGPGHLIELRAYPILTGQVVEADGNTVVPGAGGWVMMGWDRNARGGYRFTADETGRFRIALKDALPEYLNLTFSRADGSARTKIEPELTGLRTNLDLGTLPLIEERRLLFRAVDPKGEPIAGAIAICEESGKQSMHSDAMGIGELDGLAIGAQTFLIGARGYATRGAQVPAGEETRIEVELTPCNLLMIQVLQPDGQVKKKARIDILIESPDVAQSLVENYAMNKDVLAGNLFYIGGRENSRTRLAFGSDEHGTLEIQGLASRSSVILQIRDGSDALAQEVKIPALGITEQRVVEILLERQMYDLRGHVMDTAGNPLVAAKITMLSDGSITFSEDSDSTGHFEVRNLSAEELRLRISKIGFATQFLNARPGKADLRIELSAGHTLRLWINDASGVSLTDKELTVEGVADLDHEIWPAQTTEDGAWLLTGLPDRELTLRVTRNKEVREFLIDPLAGETSLQWRD